ncbi:N-acetylmuramoyl-L-alanine amidase [Oceanobacillus damuensis]|uniref:N-acetylmuramoyl-L-alanine amidase n=1 Tax=Oceanobacillus damuensis TaxID=937928 RepID=UPI0008298B50|nr:N-acetylmuramoyl-L-alanine amidase [Oceanobacillus damuensis]
MYIRKIILLLFTAFIFLCALGTEQAYANEGVIEGSNLNIRSGPGTEYESIGQAETGETYQVVQQADGWVEIELEKETGWVSAEFITINETASTDSTVPLEDSDISSITIQYDNTQLRDGPSTEHAIVHFAEKGTEYEVVSTSGEWYEIRNGELTGFVLKELVETAENNSTYKGFKNKTIVIDAGHGGRDVGAVSDTDAYEKDITYVTAKELEKQLQYLGADVLLTREQDEFVSLTSRVTYSNLVDSDAFISLHYNSVPELPEVTGIETFYYSKQNEKMANYIHNGIISATDETDRGSHEGDLLVLRLNLKPSVLIELGFMSNPESDVLLQTNAYQKKLVSGIVDGLNKYFHSVE